jgi:methanogenic corrinoid protein MtbC1
MAKGYQVQELKQQLVDILANSKTGLSGIEISEKLGINRVTMAKYLNVFATEGMIGQKNIGYFRVKTKYLELLSQRSEQKSYNLIRNCIHSNANISKLMNEIILPATQSVQELFEQGKISKSESKLLGKIISNSIQILNQVNAEIDNRKNVIIISADSQSIQLAEAASASFHSEGWNVSSLGDMSDAIDVMFDLDLQNFLGKIWTKNKGIMIIVIFSATEEGLKFFAQAGNSAKGKFGKNLNLILCSDMKKKTSIKADLVENNLESVLQWSQTTFERFTK